jgi:hypothetical protein
MIHRNPIALISMTFVLFLLSGCGSSAAKPVQTDAAFTIIALPDTQLYSLHHPDIFMAQTEWIKNNRQRLNIICVVHEGDITNNNTPTEWRTADRAMSVLDDEVPYCMVPGNHDMRFDTHQRDTTLFNEHFGPDRFEGKPWYGGNFEGTSDNAYYLFETGTLRLMVLCLEFGPRDETLHWANNVAAEHSRHKIIVVTHSYMNFDDTLVGPGDKYNPHEYPWAGNDGQQMWDKFVRRHDNIILVLSGHILGDGRGRLASRTDGGFTVNQVLANYQMLENGGNGWLRIMQFIPQDDRIVVSTYSPTLNRYATDEENAFVLENAIDRRPQHSARP